MKLYSIVMLLVAVGLSACKSTKMTELTPLGHLDEVPSSMVHLPVRLSKSEVERVLNQQLPEILYQNMQIESDKGALFYIGAKRNGNIELLFDSMNFYYTVPVAVTINQDKFLGGIESTGDLELRFSTTWEISSDWELQTTTRLIEHHWSRKPVLSVFGIDIPIRFIGDFIIRRSRNVLVKVIDDKITESADLENRVKKYWDYLKDPILLEEENKLWLQLEPESFAMSPVVVDQDTLQTEFLLEAITHITVGEKPDSLEISLPPFQMVENQDAQFYIHMQTGISYPNLESRLQALVIGESFSVTGQRIVIDTLNLYTRNDKIQIIMNLSGDIQGKAFGEGVPFFNANDKELRIDIQAMDLKTPQFFWKTATRILRKKIEKKLESFMHVSIKENLDELELTISREIRHLRVNDYLSFEGEIKEMGLTRCFLGEKGVQIVLSSSGHLNGNIKLDPTP